MTTLVYQRLLVLFEVSFVFLHNFFAHFFDFSFLLFLLKLLCALACIFLFRRPGKRRRHVACDFLDLFLDPARVGILMVNEELIDLFAERSPDISRLLVNLRPEILGSFLSVFLLTCRSLGRSRWSFELVLLLNLKLLVEDRRGILFFLYRRDLLRFFEGRRIKLGCCLLERTVLAFVETNIQVLCVGIQKVDFLQFHPESEGHLRPPLLEEFQDLRRDGPGLLDHPHNSAQRLVDGF